MRRLAWLAALAAPAWAHMVSISTGELRLAGNHLSYSLRMPLYELTHIQDPERAIFENLRFSSGGRAARLLEKSCRRDALAGAYYCEARYEFQAPPDAVDVECTFHSITVPNHVHLLRAVKRGETDKTDQAVFDLSFPRATLRFNPPPPWETAFRQVLSGMARAAGGAAQILFLAALALAARSRRELVALTAAFLVGEVAACLTALLAGWQPAPRFVEAAAALTVAYLAVEILLLPKAGARWAVAGALGGFHGLYFAVFVQTSGYHAAYVLTGMAVVEIAALAVIAWLLARLARVAAALRPVQVSASLLLAIGLSWFLLRLKG